jgi:hypothetical protein
MHGGRIWSSYAKQNLTSHSFEIQQKISLNVSGSTVLSVVPTTHLTDIRCVFFAKGFKQHYGIDYEETF